MNSIKILGRLFGVFITFLLLGSISAQSPSEQLLKYVEIRNIDKTRMLDYYVYYKYNIHTIHVLRDIQEETNYWILVPNKDRTEYLITGSYNSLTISENTVGPSGQHFDIIYKGQYYDQPIRYEEAKNIVRSGDWARFPDFAKHWLWENIIEPNWKKSRELYDLFYYAVDSAEVFPGITFRQILLNFVNWEWKKISYCMNRYEGSKFEQCLKDPLSVVDKPNEIESWDPLSPELRYLVLPEKIEWTPEEKADNGEPLLPLGKDKVWIWYKIKDPEENILHIQLIVGWYVEDRHAQTSTKDVTKESTYRVYYKYLIDFDMDAILNIKCTRTGACKVFLGWDGNNWVEGDNPHAGVTYKAAKIDINAWCGGDYCAYTVCIYTGKGILQRWKGNIKVTLSLNYNRAICGKGCTFSYTPVDREIEGWGDRCISGIVRYSIKCECCNMVHVYNCTSCKEDGTCGSWVKLGCCHTSASYKSCGCNNETCYVCYTSGITSCSKRCGYPVSVTATVSAFVDLRPYANKVDNGWDGNYLLYDQKTVSTTTYSPSYTTYGGLEWDCFLEPNCDAGAPINVYDTWPDGYATSCNKYAYAVVPIKFTWTRTGEGEWTAVKQGQQRKNILINEVPNYWEGTAYAIFKLEFGTTGSPGSSCSIRWGSPGGWRRLDRIEASPGYIGWIAKESMTVQPGFSISCVKPEKERDITCYIEHVDVSTLASKITSTLYSLLQWYVTMASSGSYYADAVKPVEVKIALLAKPIPSGLKFSDVVSSSTINIDHTGGYYDSVLAAVRDSLYSMIDQFREKFQEEAQPEYYFDKVSYAEKHRFVIKGVFPNTQVVEEIPTNDKIVFKKADKFTIFCKGGDVKECDSVVELNNYPFSGTSKSGEPINYGYTTKIIWLQSTSTASVKDIKTTSDLKLLENVAISISTIWKNYGTGVSVEIQDRAGKTYYVDIYAPLPVKMCNDCGNFVGSPTTFAADNDDITAWYTGVIPSLLVLGWGVPWPKGVSKEVPSEWYLTYFLPVSDVLKLRILTYGISATKDSAGFIIGKERIVFPAGTAYAAFEEGDKNYKLSHILLHAKYTDDPYDLFGNKIEFKAFSNIYVNPELSLHLWKSPVLSTAKQWLGKNVEVASGTYAGTYNPSHFIWLVQSPFGRMYTVFSPIGVTVAAENFEYIKGVGYSVAELEKNPIGILSLLAHASITDKYGRLVVETSKFFGIPGFIFYTTVQKLKGPSFEDLIERSLTGSISILQGCPMCVVYNSFSNTYNYASEEASINELIIKGPPGRYKTGALYKYKISGKVADSGVKACDNKGTPCGMLVQPYDLQFELYEFYQAFLTLEEPSQIVVEEDYIKVNPSSMSNEAKEILAQITEDTLTWDNEYAGAGGTIHLIRDAKNILADLYGGKRKGAIILGSVVMPIDTPVSWEASSAPWLIILFSPPTDKSINKFDSHHLAPTLRAYSYESIFYGCFVYSGYTPMYNIVFEGVYADGGKLLGIPVLDIEISPSKVRGGVEVCYITTSTVGSPTKYNPRYLIDFAGDYYVLPNWQWNYVVVRDSDGNVLWEGYLDGIKGFRWKVVYQKIERSSGLVYEVTVKFAQLPSADKPIEVQAFVELINKALANAKVNAQIDVPDVKEFIKDVPGVGKVIIGSDFSYSVIVQTDPSRSLLYADYVLNVYDKNGNLVDRIVLYSRDPGDLGEDRYGRKLPQELPAIRFNHITIKNAMYGKGSAYAALLYAYEKLKGTWSHVGITGLVPLLYPTKGLYGLLPWGWFDVPSKYVNLLPVYRIKDGEVYALMTKDKYSLIEEYYLLLRQYIEPNYEEGPGYYDSVKRALESYSNWMA